LKDLEQCFTKTGDLFSTSKQGLIFYSLYGRLSIEDDVPLRNINSNLLFLNPLRDIAIINFQVYFPFLLKQNPKK
jgi:hypothetical protein